MSSPWPSTVEGLVFAPEDPTLKASLLHLLLFANATYPQRALLTERRRRRYVALVVQAHAFVLGESDGQRPLCMVPRAQPLLSQVLKMPRPLALQPGLTAVPLVSRTSQGVLGQLVCACLRPASNSIEGHDPGSFCFLRGEEGPPPPVLCQPRRRRLP